MTTEQQDFIPCCHHADQPATQNCMGCGNPLCMDCVRENGYYCSDACKQSVQASEPDAVKAEDQAYAEVDQRVEQTMAVAGSFVSKLKWPVIIVIVALVAFWVYRNYFGPEGKVVASMEFSSKVMLFEAQDIGDGKVLVQADDELSVVEPATGETLWSVALQPLEIPAQRASDRYHVHLVGVHEEMIIMQTGAKLLALDRDSGEVAWTRIDTNSYPRMIEVHDQGIICGGWQALSCLEPTEGAVRWTTTNRLWQSAETAFVDNDIVFVYQPPVEPVEQKPEKPKEEPLTAGGGIKIDARALLAAARGEDPPADEPATSEYIIEYVSVTTGEPRGQVRLSFSDSPELESLGDLLCIYGGRQLAAFTHHPEPLWQRTLPAEIVSLAHGEGAIAVATENGVTLLDIQTGEPRWTRDDLDPHGLAVGPDGGVYATISMKKKEAADYRAARVAEQGSAMPFEHVKVLLRLDPETGETEWGVRQIGDRIIFVGDDVYVFDTTDRVDLLANSGIFSGHYSVRQLNPKNGRDRWVCVQQGLLFEQWISDGRVCLVAAEEPAHGRLDPWNAYLLQIVEAR